MKRFGWGGHPGEVVSSLNSDTGELFSAPLNKRGFRDRERSYANRRGAYRIVVVGDSNTFGATVPPEESFTQVLERKLAAAGYNAEVINISYYGWGTDQEYEALKLEGMKYHPDLVILQFCLNDLEDTMRGNGSRNWPKPFYYRIEGGRLVRLENQSFKSEAPGIGKTGTVKGKLKFLATKLELTKRLAAAYINVRSIMAGKHAQNKQATKYRVGPAQIEKLKYALHLTDDDRLIAYLRKQPDTNLERADIIREIQSAGHAKNQAFILRLCEDRIFRNVFYRDGYYPRKFDPKGSDWRLVLGLMKASAGMARMGGAKFAILSDNERGQHDWMQYWWFIPDRPWARRNIASGEKILQTFAVENGVDLIPNRQRVERLRNDPHPSAAGNDSIADNLFEYLEANHGTELARHRK